MLVLCSLREKHPQTRNKTAQPCLCESKDCRKFYKFMTLIMHFHSLFFRSHCCVMTPDSIPQYTSAVTAAGCRQCLFAAADVLSVPQ